MKRQRPIGSITRGTTNPNRLRRVDAWIAWKYGDVLRNLESPTIIDLGYGASPITTLEMSQRIRQIAPRTKLVGLEIDRERVAAAKPFEDSWVQFREGGFELAGIEKPVLVRAFNVLRQYRESEVEKAWTQMLKTLHPSGAIIDGTCDELGRLATWIEITRTGPQSLTVSVRLKDLVDPIEIAERLPKALIHRNVQGNPIHDFIQDLQRSWQSVAGVGVFGPRQRWAAATGKMREGWPISSPKSRDRLGEITVEWRAISR
ncbi:MAG TPA: class I SAM-dependent methyltransferase [Candidatus Nanopelagicaceae bacterium]|nr:class I SAM-dependent methyltransferase [Candidatus Nanopelagicaceae bacterium]